MARCSYAAAPVTEKKRALACLSHGAKAFFVERSERPRGRADRDELAFAIIPYSFCLKVRDDPFLRAVDRMGYVVPSVGPCTC
jgi:hypothetical protein